MVNVGRPSQDCHLCRRRRVKCDLTRPSCFRCKRYGAECPGYRSEKDVVFRNAFLKVSTGPQRAGQPPDRAAALSAQASVGPAQATSLTWVSCHTQEVPAPSPTSASVKEHWTTHSIPLLMECFSSVRYFTRILGKVPEQHPLALVSHAFARTYMGNRCNAPQDKREVSMYLGKALRAIQASINDASRSKEDGTLVAVWLLGNYEILSGSFEKRGSDASPYAVHSAGLASLLQNRGPRKLADPLVRQMFWSLYNTIQIESLISNRRCPEELGIWLDRIEGYVTPEEESMLKIARFIRAACSIFEVAMPSVVGAKFAQACACYPDLVRTIQEAEAISPSISPQQGNVISCSFWNSWCGARIKLDYVTILISGLVEHAPNSPHGPEILARQRNLCRDNTALTSAEIIKSLPVSMGGSATDIDPNLPSAGYAGLRLIWPLTATFMIPTVPTAHRQAAKLALLKVGKDIGILQALRGYAGSRRYPKEAMSDIVANESVRTDGYMPDICSPSGSDRNQNIQISVASE